MYNPVYPRFVGIFTITIIIIIPVYIRFTAGHRPFHFTAITMKNFFYLQIYITEIGLSLTTIWLTLNKEDEDGYINI